MAAGDFSDLESSNDHGIIISKFSLFEGFLQGFYQDPHIQRPSLIVNSKLL